LTTVGCVYHFFESDSEHQENLKYFLKHGILQDVYYVIVLASEPNFQLPVLSNVSFHRITNEHRDVGGYIKGYKIINKIADWDYIFFLNSGVLGPIRFEGLSSEKNTWVSYFLGLFKEGVQLVGTSINTMTRPATWSDLEEQLCNSQFKHYFSQHSAVHVQSFFFCLKRESRHFLDSIGFFDQNLSHEFTSLVANFEIALTQIILNTNSEWTVKSNLAEYNNFNLKNLECDPNFSSWNGDPYFQGAFFGSTIDPRKAVFFKTTRSLLSIEELKSYRNI